MHYNYTTEGKAGTRGVRVQRFWDATSGKVTSVVVYVRDAETGATSGMVTIRRDYLNSQECGWLVAGRFVARQSVWCADLRSAMRFALTGARGVVARGA